MCVCMLCTGDFLIRISVFGPFYVPLHFLSHKLANGASKEREREKQDGTAAITCNVYIHNLIHVLTNDIHLGNKMERTV